MNVQHSWLIVPIVIGALMTIWMLKHRSHVDIKGPWFRITFGDKPPDPPKEE